MFLIIFFKKMCGCACRCGPKNWGADACAAHYQNVSAVAHGKGLHFCCGAPCLAQYSAAACVMGCFGRLQPPVRLGLVTPVVLGK